MFKKGKWNEEINLQNFINLNYTEYLGDESFLEKPTSRTLKILEICNDLFKKEREKGGVLDIDTERVSSILAYDEGYIHKNLELIVGLQTDAPLKRAVNPFAGKRMCKSACEAYGYTLSEKVENAFTYRTTHNDGVFNVYSDTMKKARHAGVITGLPDAYARGRIIGDYRRVALYGVDKLIEEKKKDRTNLQDLPMTEENITLIEEVSKQISFLVQLKDMAKGYGSDISKGATNFKEAVQWLYFAYLGAVKEQNGAANSIGRITEFLDIFAQNDLGQGKITENEIQEIIDDFVIKLRLVRHLRTPDYNELFAGDPTWVTVALGGMCCDGRTKVTKTAYRFLHTLYNLGSQAEPNITVLWSQKLPTPFKNYCAKVSIDTDSIQYENDDLMIKDFSDDYSIACCVSAMKTGKQMQYFGARCNLAKVFLMSLNGGKDELTGEQIAKCGKTFDGLLNYDEVLKSYLDYVEWIADLYVNTLNIIHFMHDKYAYERLMLSLHDTSIERLMAFGISGFSVVVDSLSAIKHGKVTAVKNSDGLIVDFVTEGDFPKFGNDDDRADSIAKLVVESFYNQLKSHKIYRNATPTLSILTITSNVVYGKKTGATPCGRKSGEPFAPGANPMHGRETEGALASLNSVAKLDYSCCKDGISNTFTITPQILGKNELEQKSRLVSILDGYFVQNAHHLNVNVLNRDTLLKAMESPEDYPNLTIRVSGYAVNFNKLSKAQQEEVVSRTFHDTL